jgi:hypothetical protein
MGVLAFHVGAGAICMVDAKIGVLHEGLMGEVDRYSGFDHGSEVCEDRLKVVGLDC